MKFGGDQQPDKITDVVDGDEDVEDNGDGPGAKEGANEVQMDGTETMEQKPPDPDDSGGKEKEKEEVVDESLEEEDDVELDLKLTLLEIYNERYDKRIEAKAFIFDRGLVADYRKVRTVWNVRLYREC
jgi:transcriptional adapter 2-alpha